MNALKQIEFTSEPELFNKSTLAYYPELRHLEKIKSRNQVLSEPSPSAPSIPLFFLFPALFRAVIQNP